MVSAENVLISDSTLTCIADTIRSKNNSTEKMTPISMVSELSKLNIDKSSPASNITVSDYINKSFTSYSNKDLTQIGGYAFADCTTLATIDCPNLMFIGDYAFQKTAISSMQADNIIYIGERAFYDSSIKEINLPNLIECGSYVFWYSGIQKLSAQKLTKIPSGFLKGCNALEELNLTWENITSIGYSAFDSSSISGDINISKCEFLDKYAFYNTHITSIKANNLKTINGNNSFGNITTLTKAEFIALESTEGAIFGSDYNHHTIQELQIPNIINIGTDSLIGIEISKLDLHKKTNINSLPYGKCNVILRSTEKCVSSGLSNYSKPTLYVPNNLINEYKSDNVWNKYTINAIEDYPDICGSGD